MSRIVLNTFGSLGDVHPYLALAIELQRRGHDCVIATAEIYRQKITSEGIGFAPVRPDVGELLNEPELIAKLWHPSKGTVYLLRDYLLPKIHDSYTDLNAFCDGADLMLTHAAGYAGPLIAAARGLPWLSVALQPAIFFSNMDPAVIAAAPWTRHLYALGPWVSRTMMSVVNRETRRWAKPIFDLRTHLNIHDTSNPVMEGAFSPLGTLTLFSGAFAGPQPDWPQKSDPTGFVFYDKRGEGFGLPPEHAGGMSKGLRTFLRAGRPPVLFTLGSSAVTHPGAFYAESVRAAQKIGMRAVLLVGKQTAGLTSDRAVYVEEYASYSVIMPLVAAVVHQGGIGTVAQTLKAGKPMLVVPWAHDQPDNGYRLQRLGVARVLPRNRYVASRAAAELKKLLDPQQSFIRSAENIAAAIRLEDGLNAACDRVEQAVKTSASCEPAGAPS